MIDTLYSRFGGAPAVARLVLDIYDRVLASDNLSPYFATVDMGRLVEHQAKFVASVMGGPAACSDGELRDAHMGLGIDAEAFDEMARLVEAALTDSGLAADEVAGIMVAIHARRPLIVDDG